MGGGGSSFQPGNMGGSFNFKPGQMTGSSGMSGNSGSGSGTGFNMGSGGGSNGFNIGSGFNTGSGSGSGSGSGGFNMGSGSGSGSGGFNMGSGSGSGSGSGGFNMGSGSGSGSGSCGFNMGSGSGSGSGSGGFNMGSGSGGFNMGSGVSSGSSSGSGTGGLNMGSGSGSLGSASGSGSGNTGMGSVTNSGGAAVGTTAVKSGATQAPTLTSSCSPSAGISGQNPPSGSCLCLAGTNVVVHANGGINAQKLGSISQPKCVTYTGSKITPCLHDATTNDKRAWFKISLNGQVGWIAGDYLAVADRSRCSSGSSSSTGGSSSSSVSGTSTPGGSGNQQQASSGTLSNCFPGAEMNALEQKLLQYESLRTTAYDAQPKSSYKDWTVCVGFNLKRGNARNVFAKALPGVSFDAVYNGQPLTREQCMKLFAYDLDANYVSQPKGRFGASFCQLPLNVKIAIVNAYYRGDMGPKTQSLIANGDWCHVKAEYLNHGDYINCVSKGIPGVCTRMDWNADQFQSMCSGKTSSSSSSPIQNSGSGSCDPVAKEYACKLLQLYNTGKLSLWDAHASKEHDSAFCINNIRDTCNGGKAQRSSYTCSECPSGAPGGSVCLNPNLLKYVYDLGSRGTEKVLVNEFAGACHHCGSWHYEGKAVDLQTSSRNQDYMDTCRRFGGTPLDEHSHIHCTIKN
ncbi:fibroin heavy chain-like [Mytilus californianus]|uniref:fibroin heavy chain-like n=1 Tax=Mytilus californianus TaxID=6549 RepID=UPI0022486690|nr:fibroin heavy chain-like [Mytilus californianus]